MSGFNVYPQPVATNRFVLKSNTAGQVLLPSLGSPVTAVAPSTTNALGSWVQVDPATAVEYYITGVLAFANADTATSVNGPLYVAIAVGGSGSETTLSIVPIGSSIGRYGASTPRFAPGGHALLEAPLRIAAGSRLAVCVALDGTAATSQNCRVYLLAVPYAAVEGN